MSALKELREKKGLSLKLVSVLTDIPIDTLGQFEKGSRDLTISKAKNLSILYGITLDEIERIKNQKNVKMNLFGKKPKGLVKVTL